MGGKPTKFVGGERKEKDGWRQGQHGDDEIAIELSVSSLPAWGEPTHVLQTSGRKPSNLIPPPRQRYVIPWIKVVQEILIVHLY